MIDRYGLGRRGINDNASSTTVITDSTNFKGPGAAAGLAEGCQLMVTLNANSAGNAPEDEIVRLDSMPKRTTGVANITPDFTQNIETNDTYDLLFKPLVFDAGDGEFSVHVAIEAVLRNYPLLERRLIPITLVTDGDMLGSDETAWTLANATDSKTAASFPHALRVIAVTDDGSGGGYTSTGNIAVEELKPYYLEVLAFGTDKDDAGSLVLYDVTNGVAISLDNSVIDRIEPEILRNVVTIPSGCKQVDIRLTCTNASDVVSWAYVIFRKDEARELTVQDRPVPPLYLGKLFATKESTWAKRGEMTEIPAKPVQMGAGLWQYHTKQSLAGCSVWYEEFIQQPALSSDTSTTPVIKEHLAAMAAEELLFPLQGRSDEWATRYAKAARHSAPFKQAYESLRTVTQGQKVYPLVHGV
jgi:hypothetical protein